MLKFRQVHIDFHTSEHIEGIGSKFDSEIFTQTLKKAHINSITIFARCHHGYTYYPSKIAPVHPHLTKKDFLNEQIIACKKAGIRVPVYVTVGWDEFTAKMHPEWLERKQDGSPHAGPLEAKWKYLCFNTPYIDYVIKQTHEVIDYVGVDNLDGLFFDIITQRPCYCNFCMERIQKDGINPKDNQQMRELARRITKEFCERMTNSVRTRSKDCTIFYNAGHIDSEIRDTLATNSHLETEALATGGWGYEYFPISAKYIRTLGVDYLGMTGKFHKSWGDFGGIKPLPALQYEVFLSLAHGAKSSIGDQMYPNGTLNVASYNLIGQVYKEVEKIEPWCEDVEATKEIAIYMGVVFGSSETGKIDDGIRGAHRILTDLNYQFNIIDLESNFSEYKCIIFPDSVLFSEKLEAKVKQFIKNGGKIICTYKSGLMKTLINEKSDFSSTLDLKFIEDSPFDMAYLKPTDKIKLSYWDDTEYALYDKGVYAKPISNNWIILAEQWNPYFNRTYEHFCSHFQTPVNNSSGFLEAGINNSVGYCAHPVFNLYKLNGAIWCKKIIQEMLEKFIPTQLIKSNAPSTAHFYLNEQRKEKRFVLHILHFIPERKTNTIDIVEDIIPIYNVEIEISLNISKATIVPVNQELKISKTNTGIKITVPKVEGHAMICLQ